MIKYRCPICEKQLNRIEKSFKCDKHCYDVAKEGYVNFLTGAGYKAESGDNKNMVASRREIMERGYYAPLINYLKAEYDFRGKTILDVGCGEGYFIRNVSQTSEAFGIDVSKEAIKFAAKADKTGNYSVASMNRLPFFDNSFDFVFSTFAPYSDSEVKRVLKSGGLFIVTAPSEDHMLSLKKLLYENVVLNPPVETELSGFAPAKRHIVNGEITLSGNDAVTLLKMTPYFYRTPKNAIENLKNVDSVTVNLSFCVSVFKS